MKTNKFHLFAKERITKILFTAIFFLLILNLKVVSQVSYNQNSIPIKGASNSAFGSGTLFSNTTGTGNTANGYKALYTNNIGFENTANGSYALYKNTGNWNTAVGSQSLYKNTSGTANTAIGNFALQGNTTGTGNTANGLFALDTNTIGSYNTALGYGADVASTNLNYATAIGAFATVSVSNAIVLGNTGIKVGIGTSAPQSLLSLGTVLNDRKLALYDNANGWYGFGIQSGQMKIQIGTANARFSFLAGNTTEVMTIKGTGNVGIGTASPQAKLDINGSVRIGAVAVTSPFYSLFVEKGILTEKMKVALKSSGDWSDYVFANDYPLKPLSEVESFVKENKHLPGVPSAEQLVKEGGIDVNQMFAKQMEKIEEMTLYMIEMNKKIQRLEQENAVLKTTITHSCSK